jgi:predicted esterase
MKEDSVQFKFNARYYKTGEVSGTKPRFCFVFHGYGHLAQYFVKKFEVLTSLGICVVAPEGLSRFYIDPLDHSGHRKSNRIGATWMTRENREMDIKNYVNYIQSVYKKEMVPNAEVTVLGFSQGAATASRWITDGQPQFHRLILWAGIFPPDMDFEKGKNILRDKEVITVYGKQDPLVTPERSKEMLELTAKLDVSPTRIEFEGKHEIDGDTLLRLF